MECSSRKKEIKIPLIKRLFSKRLLFLKQTVNKENDCNGRCETPVGVTGKMRQTPQSPRRLIARPTESEHPGVEIDELLF